MKKHVLSLLLTLLIISCSNNTNSSQQQNNIGKTPEALNKEKGLDISSSLKRYNSDIIQKLFEEAVEKDESLKSLTLNLKEAKETRYDSLKSYLTYKNNNLEYWNSLSRYTNKISDSVLKNKLIKFIKSLKDKHYKRTAPLDSLVSRIDSTEQKLNDLEILMKIMVTEPMMSNYQHNEYPDIKTLKSIKKVLDTSIIQIKPYTKIQK